MNKIETVSSISEIRFGLYAQPEISGNTAYIQLRQFSENGRLTSHSYDFINLDNKSQSHLLKDGDVLFVGKGSRLFAWCYQENGMPAVASSVFFVLRPKLNKIHPGYLEAVLNAPQSKAVFQQIGGGTSIFSIRKSELGAFQIPLPQLQQQKKVAALAQLHQKEIELAQDIISQKQYLYTAMISKLIK